MSHFVLDASVLLARYFREPQAAGALERLDALDTSSAVVPGMWQLEILNGLLMGMRRGRLARAQVDGFVAELARLGVHVDRETPDSERIVVLAQGHGLTAYDASYLELALRRALPLATLDKAMQQAARRAGVPLIA
ncbi:MAG TPA: type II toxin-antitoxin system VapC family toxin [Terriglobales bacterium]|nr:type II toxin-antitoxin system VapC family toxin [Terriglobales bacterium]